MSASKSPRNSTSKRASTIRLTCWLRDGDADLWHRTEAMNKLKALDAMKNVVDEMRMIMGRGKIGQRRAEPSWLTDAVEAELFRRHIAVAESRSVDWNAK